MGEADEPPQHEHNHGFQPRADEKSDPDARPTVQRERERGPDMFDTKVEDDSMDNLSPEPWSKRLKDGSQRFAQHSWNALTYSWLNILLVFVPLGIAMNYVPLAQDTKDSIVFAFNAIAIIPLAGLLSHATESVASRMGDTWASLLNVTFGNAVELIIFIIALAKNEIEIVQASILGSILANLLLILGMSFLFGGLRYREQIYNSTVTQMSACLLSLSVVSLLLPTAFHASFASGKLATQSTLKISRGTSVVLLLVYILYLLFQLKSHAYMYESTPQYKIDEEAHPGVLADIMNSSDSSSSSSSSDSDSSEGSHHTAKQRLKKVFRHRKHRKSSSSSGQGPSSPSVEMSVSTDKPGSKSLGTSSFQEEANQSSEGHDKIAGVPYTDYDKDADAEDEETGHKSRIRDFGTKIKSEKSNDGSSSRKHRGRSTKARTRDQKLKSDSVPPQTELDGALAHTSSAPAPTATLSSGQGAGNANEKELDVPPTASPQRIPFTKRQMSRPTFKTPLPNLLTNTVFTTPQPPTANSGQVAGLSIVRGKSSGIRRTSSLPDRLSRPLTQPGITPTASVPPVQTFQAGTVPRASMDGNAKPDQDYDDMAPQLSRTAAVMMLLITTGLVAFCAELLVEAIPDMVKNSGISQAFIGLIILPIVGNAAEHVTAVTMATKNKMDLAIGVAVGSSIQIALFVTPLVVLLGWILEKGMSLYFNLFETISLFVTAFVVNFLVLDGRSNYLEGSLLIAAYIIIALAAFFYPNPDEESSI